MRVKRYVVDTMPDAMHSIRSELGSDAVILSTKEIKVGGFMGMFTKKRRLRLWLLWRTGQRRPRRRSFLHHR
ncbi:hypothetical protein ACFTAO_26755 [Paenibacillus rhizoplanae]